MGHHHEGLAQIFIQLTHQLPHLQAIGRVEVAGGFIRQHDGGFIGQSPAESDALLFAATELIWEVAFPVLKAQAGQDLQGFFPGSGYLLAGDKQRQCNVFCSGEVFHQIVELKHKSYL